MDVSEFDRFAEEYTQTHQENIAITGETSEYFHEYKIKELCRMARERNLRPGSILDFGSGVGNSTPYLRRYFPYAQLAVADVSQRSLEIGESQSPGVAKSLQIVDQRIPADDNAFAISFSACVFHHIVWEEHIHWLCELLRVTRPGGMIAIFEHNPLNPLTVRAVNTCPFDEHAHLIRAKELIGSVRQSGWKDAETRYELFFPRMLGGLRMLERYLAWVPLGAQYCVVATKPR